MKRLHRDAEGDAIDDGDKPEPWRSSDPGMEIREKVNKWLSKSTDMEEESYSGDLYHDAQLDDLDELEDDDLPELPLYRQALIESSAYRSLLSRLQVKRHLMTPFYDAKSPIRNRIIGAYGRSDHFSRRDHREVKIQFQLDWNLKQFLQDQEYNRPLEHAFEHGLTITGTGNNVQSATCLEYMQQIWPETGKELLSLFQKGLKDDTETWSGKIISLLLN